MLYSCPNCHSHNIGKIANNQFYCWNCYIELVLVRDKFIPYQVEEDGTLSSLDDLFTEEELQIQR